MVRARVVNSRLRVGRFVRPGDAVTLTQHDGTTCGATCVLAACLLRGQVPEPVRRAADGPMSGSQLLVALAEEQRRIQRAMNRRGLGILPWPQALGSTPWTLAAAMTRTIADAGAPYTVRQVRDVGPRWPAQVERLRTHLAAGTPVVLLAGGPLTRPRPGDAGAVRHLRTAVAAVPPIPRHYVLALPHDLAGVADPGEGRAVVYEPSSGTVRILDLLAPRPPRGPGPHELGLWPRVLAILSPRSSRGRRRLSVG